MKTCLHQMSASYEPNANLRILINLDIVKAKLGLPVSLPDDTDLLLSPCYPERLDNTEHHQLHQRIARRHGEENAQPHDDREPIAAVQGPHDVVHHRHDGIPS